MAKIKMSIRWTWEARDYFSQKITFSRRNNYSFRRVQRAYILNVSERVPDRAIFKLIQYTRLMDLLVIGEWLCVGHGGGCLLLLLLLLALRAVHVFVASCIEGLARSCVSVH